MKAMKTFAALLALAFSLAGCGAVDGSPVRPAPGSAGQGSSTAASGADSAEHTALDRLVSEQLEERAEARKAKDFARADAIRDALGAAGITIEDTPQGPTWTLK